MKIFWKKQKADTYIQLYDDLASSLKSKDELAFLKKHFSKTQEIIEFGCGTGRTLFALLKAGYRISGLDFSKEMLKVLQKKLTTNQLKTDIFNKDLTNFSLNKKFDGAILSQRTLNFITTREGQKKALLNISKSLNKSAILIINLMPARPNDFAIKQTKFNKTESFVNSHTQNIVSLWEKWFPNPMDQTWEIENKFIEKGKEIVTKMKMRIIFEAEMENLLELCGFKTLKVYGNWKKIKYDEKSSDLIIVARKI